MTVTEEWFTLDDIEESDNSDTLYCISVDSPEEQFLVGEIGVPTHNTDEGKEEDSLKGEAAMIIGSIARLGRAAGVHLVIATQRPDATIISGETKANLGVRINCGRTDSNASNMILGSSDGTQVKASPRGRLYLRIYGSGDHGQGFFAPSEWMDNYLASKGLNPDGSPISQKRSRLANVADMSSFAEGDLDSREGIDNSAIIEKIRQEESDDDWNFDDEDDEVMSSESPASQQRVQDAVPSAPPADDKLGRPEIGMKAEDPNRFKRPEEDWDGFMDALIEANS